MPQAWAARLKDPYAPGKVVPSDKVYVNDASSVSDETRIYYTDPKPKKESKKPKSDGCCKRFSKNCRDTKCPLWCVLLTIAIIVLILLLAFGLSFGLTYEMWRKKYDSNKEPTSTTTTMKPRKDCKNFGIWNVETDECECREFTSGEFCEKVASCDDLPDDPVECPDLADFPDVDKEAFEAFCPKTARCKTVRKSILKIDKCENHGLYDYQKSKCICLPHSFGERCENVKDCKQMNDDPIECNIFQEVFKQHISSYQTQCPKSFFCS